MSPENVLAADELLHDLRTSKTDLARIVKAVVRDRLRTSWYPFRPSSHGSAESRRTGPRFPGGWPPKRWAW